MHTLSPDEEIKSQMRGAWGGISQTSSQELRVRFSRKLSNLQLQWKYYTCTSLKWYVFTWWPHMKSLMVTHGHQGSTWGCLVYQHNFMGLLLPGNWDEENWGEQSVYIREKLLWACQEAKPFMPSGLGPPMVFVHFLMALLERSIFPFSKRALASYEEPDKNPRKYSSIADQLLQVFS